MARRLALTPLAWVASGGPGGGEQPAARAGDALRRLAVFVVAATGKALLYDTTHLGGGRAFVLLAAGACLLGGSLVVAAERCTEGLIGAAERRRLGEERNSPPAVALVRDFGPVDP